MTPTTLLPQSAIVWDHATQMRVTLSQDAINEYTVAFAGYGGYGDFPPVDVFFDGATHWGANGWHRKVSYAAWCKAAGRDLPIPCTVHQGSLRDAILFAAQADNRGPVKRTPADKRNAVEAILRDPEGATWSNREIARRCNVSDKLVADVRAALDAGDASAETRRYDERTVTRNGQTYVMNTAAIGARTRLAYPRPAGTDKPAAVAQSVTQDLPAHLRDLVRFAHYEGDVFRALTRHGAVQSADWNDLIEQIETLLAGAGAPSAPLDAPQEDALNLGTNDHHPLTLGAPAPAHSNGSNGSAPAYAVGKCIKCGRTLTDPAHVAAGIGPCCAARLNGGGNGNGADDEDEDAAPALLPVSERPGYDSDEWYTPAWLLDIVRKLFGGVIGLDPASCDLAQQVVQANRYYTKDEDGLAHEWKSEGVFLNMPYSNPRPWVEKAVAEHAAGRARRIVVLVNNATETDWFQSLLRQFPVCFLDKRLAYWRHDHSDVGARQGQALFYLGDLDSRGFTRTFAPHGVVLTKMVGQ